MLTIYFAITVKGKDILKSEIVVVKFSVLKPVGFVMVRESATIQMMAMISQKNAYIV